MRQAVNILMLGGAKRVSIARMLKRAGQKLGLDVSLFSYELDRDVPVAVEASVIVGRRWSDPMLMADLHDVVVTNNIDIVLPFVDKSVEIAARLCNAESGCWTPGSDPEKAALLFDKVDSDSVFRNAGFPVPADASSLSPEKTVIAKPRCGSASQGIRVLDRQSYLALIASGEADQYICQEYVSPREEITVDCFVASSGEIICAVPRRRIAVAGGEVTDTVTIADSAIEALSHKILRTLALRGPVTIQFLRRKNPDGTLGEPMLMEINPRLGGGAVCAVHAGADIPYFILADWLHKPLVPCRSWKPGVRIVRYMQEVVFNE